MLIVTSIFTWLGIVALIEVGVEYDVYDYSALGRFCFGKIGELVVDLSIVLYSIGALMSYIVVVGTLGTELISRWGWTDLGYELYIITALLIGLFALPNCCRKHFGYLGIISVISISAVVCVLFLVIIAGPIVSKSKVKKPIYFTKNGAAQELGSIIFALCCTTCTFHTFRYLRTDLQTTHKWRQIAGTAVIIGAFFLISMGLVGYMIFGNETKSLIVSNFHGSYADVFKLLVIIHLLLYIPLDFMILRHSLIKLCGSSTGTVDSFLLHIFLSTILLVVITAAVLILYYKGQLLSENFYHHNHLSYFYLL